MYFGLEEALCGNSPGVLFKQADLFQYVQTYLESPDYLPKSLQEKVHAKFDAVVDSTR